MRRRGSAVVLAAAVAFGTLGVTAVPAEAAKAYKNCTALHKDYKHGVGLPGAKDRTSGTPVTNFKKSKALYNANKKSDRDKDGIACEKR